MADINKPDLTNLWASDGAIIPPSPSKIKTGWVAEIPPHQWENYVQNRQDVALSYLLQKGVPEWDEKTEYIVNKSFVQFGGDIYKCIQTNTGENPSSKPDYWKPLRDVYSEELELGSAASADVVQSTGDSEDDVMSQKAVTDALNSKANISNPGSMGIGVGQTWQNMTSSRTLDTNYTNTTGRTIWVSVAISLQQTSRGSLHVDGLEVSRVTNGSTAGNAVVGVSGPVPPGGVYFADSSFASATISLWEELR